jgi:hypothetical protein
MRSIVIAITLFLLTLTSNSYGWGRVGHMMVADIAYAKLQPQVKAKVDTMVSDFTKEYPDFTTFAQIATWADAIKGQSINVFSHWHYYNAGISDDGTPVKDESNTDNALWAINQIEPIIKNDQVNHFDRARFLAFYIHIVGDLHQPLHVVERFSKENMDGDEGGNLYPIQYQIKSFTITNLHGLWDYGMGLFDNSLTPEDIKALETTITTQYPETYFGAQVNDLDPKDWVAEGVQVSKFVYSTPENKVPEQAYIDTGKQIAEQKIALAGYRLAALLNKLLS